MEEESSYLKLFLPSFSTKHVKLTLDPKAPQDLKSIVRVVTTRVKPSAFLATMRKPFSSKNSFATDYWPITKPEWGHSHYSLRSSFFFLCITSYLFPLPIVSPFSSPLLPTFLSAPPFHTSNGKYSILPKIPSFKPGNMVKEEFIISFSQKLRKIYSYFYVGTMGSVLLVFD